MQRFIDQARFVAGNEKVMVGSKLPYWLIVLQVIIADVYFEALYRLGLLQGDQPDDYNT